MWKIRNSVLSSGLCLSMLEVSFLWTFQKFSLPIPFPNAV